jgi:hypothetical protein
MSEYDNMLQDMDINEMMIEEGENINRRLRSNFKFFNKRIKHYNMEILILTSKVLKLKKDILAYNEILEEYKKDVEKQVQVDILECKLCRDDLSNCIIEPCKHIVCCYDCFKKIEDGRCPMCRVEYTECYKIYF